MSKYYTPSIEEFHVGFEYEYSGNKGKEWDADSIENLYDFEDLIDDIRYGDIRVKYLDKEDIESLGFKFSKCEGDFRYFTIGKNIELMVGSNYIIENLGATVLISNKENGNTFEGIIKNISELKRLLKQLGINE